MKKINIKNSIIRQFIAVIAITVYVFSSNSCANQGVGPNGGPQDTIVPVMLHSSPLPFETNYTGNEIQLTFDEYVVADNLSAKLVVSPPLAESVSIKTKGKSIFVKINEDLIPNRTYSVDFKDGIKDYNEGNKLESFRMLFSTYDQIDTLRIDGYLLDAFTLEPVENAMATLYSFENDSLFVSLGPDFIAKSDDKGYFLFDNLPEGNYKLYGLVDGDNNLYFSQETEQIGFTDSLITPSVEFIQEIDTIFQENDTIISNGYSAYHPENQYSLLFFQDYYAQYLNTYERETEDKIMLTFNESLSDSFHVDLIEHEKENWSYTEFSQNRDTVSIWITDTLISVIDSLYLRIDYTALDTVNNFITRTDTLDAFFLPKTMKSKKKKEQEESVKLFDIKTNLASSNFDLNKSIVVTTPIPVENFVDSLIHFDIIVNDSTFETVNFKLEALPNSKRNFIINYQTLEETQYRLVIDSASVLSSSGITNDEYKSIFKTQKEDYYGTAIFELNGFNSNGIIQLLKNSQTEEIIKEIRISPNDKSITFDYLKPDKYKVKLIFDENNNGKWDTGNIELKRLPEKVFYFSKIIKIKSNWELKESWDIELNTIHGKDLFDADKKDDE